MPSVLIIGAGPAGLATGACLRERGVHFDLVDRRGGAGGAYAEMRPGLRLLSPARYTNLPEKPWDGVAEYARADVYLRYLQDYAAHFELVPRRDEVLEITHTGPGFEVRLTSHPTLTQQHNAVVVATGVFGHPRWPEIPGLPVRGAGAALTALHARDWTGAEACRGKRLLIIGGGISGVEIAEECAALPQNIR